MIYRKIAGMKISGNFFIPHALHFDAERPKINK